MSRTKLLLTAVFAPYGVKDEYAEDLGCQMELLNNQITREQGIHSPRQSYWSFGLYLMAENLSVQTAVLDFPTWKEFTEELEKGYTHVGISFIVPNVMKARRMARYVRDHHPETKIILGGYGTIIPDLGELVPHDEVCSGEGVRWTRQYFGDDPHEPVTHPVIIGPAYESIYGYHGKPKGGILLTGLGCENGCNFCITSHKFNKCYVPLLRSGAEVFQACERSESEARSTGFSVMDENFLKQPQRARELLEQMEEHGKPYVFDLFSSAETIRDLGVDFLVRLGVHIIWIGVESKATAFKKTKGIDLAALIEELQEHGIVVQASAILFQDHHDRTTIQEDIDWVIGLDSDLVQFMNYTPFPSTSLYQRLKKEGRLNGTHYRHLHGQGRLAFDHPHFNDPRDHVEILQGAFKKKYRVHGPGVLSMALTAIRGYRRAVKDYQTRQEQGLVWCPETLRYVKSSGPTRDRFMELRIRKMQKIAMNIRPVLRAAWVFAPNRQARAKAAAAIELYNEVLGRPSVKDRTRSLGLVASGTVELLRLFANNLLGRETIVRQPPSRLTEYPEILALPGAVEPEALSATGGA